MFRPDLLTDAGVTWLVSGAAVVPRSRWPAGWMVGRLTAWLAALLFALVPMSAAAAVAEPARLHVVTDDNYPPYLFRDDNGEVTGYLVDYWALWQRKTGVPVTLTGTQWQEAQRRVLAGEADVIDMIFRTPAREPLYDYTAPYADLPVNVYTHKSIAGIASVNELKGFKIGVQAGDACVEELSRRGLTNQAVYPNYAGLLAGAERKEFRVFCLDQYPAQFYLHKLGLEADFHEAFTLYTGQFHRATPKGHLETLRLVERGSALISPAELEALADKWYGATARADKQDTVRRLILIVAGALVTGGALVLGWILLLRKQVAVRTQDLQRSEHNLSASVAQLSASQAQLSQSQAQLHLALDAAQAGIWHWDIASGDNTWSDQVWRLYGLDREQPSNYESWCSSIDAGDVEAVQAAVTRAVAARTGFETTWRVRGSGGEPQRWLLSRGRPQVDAGGELTSYLGIVIDITDRLQAQSALRRSDARLRTLVDTLPDLVWLKDPDGVYLTCNRRAEQLFGASEADILGRTDSDFVSAEVAASFRDHDRAALAAGGPVVKEEELVFASDGHRELHQTIKTPIRDAEGELIGVLGVGRDITELRRTAQELEAHRQHLEEVVEQRTRELATERRRLDDILVGTDAGTWERNIVSGEAVYNERWAGMLGYTLAQLAPLTHRTWTSLVHPDDLPAAEALLRQHFQGQLPLYECELRMKHRQGHWVWVHARGKITGRSADGQPLLMSGTHLDISLRKAAEIELHRAKEAAEAAASAKGHFLANMSHEIRTPLNGVLGLAQIGYRDSKGRGRAQATFGRILDSGKVLLSIVNDILDFSKIEAGKLAIETMPFDPASIVHETVQGMAVLASAKSLPVVAEIDGLPAAVLGDPLRITQILYNLLANAIKFTESGEVRVCASVQGGDLVFAVYDTGIGIEPEALERLFQPFEQADGSFSRKFGGTGLGLTISRRLAELMEGALDVRSAPGQGSTFTLRLPLRPTDRPVLVGSRPSAAGTVRLAGLRLLVAEDNAVNQLVMDELLRAEGAEVVLADDGRQALEAVQRAVQPFDLVLMDVQMPGMDGLEATRLLGLSHPGLPVIGQTAHALKEEMDRCLAAGMVATVQKPIDLEVLVSTLLEQVQITRDGRADPATRDEGLAAPDLV